MLTLYDGLTFSDNMAISWFPNKPAHKARLIDYDDDEVVKAWISGNLMRGVRMDKLHADVVVFPNPVLMYIPSESIPRNRTSRRILVQGTVYKVLKRIYKEYQKKAKKKEIDLSLPQPVPLTRPGCVASTTVKPVSLTRPGYFAPKLIDQMSDLKRYLGWVYDEPSNVAYLYFH